MNADAKPPETGIIIKSNTIAMCVGILTLFSAAFAGFSKISSYELRLSQLEYANELRSNEIKGLNTELKSINDKLTGLTIEIRGSGMYRKADEHK